MRHDKLGLQLELLLMLTENRRWSIDAICKRLGLQQRNVYYYLNFFKQAEFQLEKRGGYYFISRNSPFISKLCDVVKFTDAEAIVLKRLLDSAGDSDLLVRSARKKLERFYDFNVLEDTVMDKKQAKIAQKLYDAIMAERMVIIHDYSSPHSSSVSDRLVEPFLMMNGNHDLRAYELSTGINKTFRISRMGSVEIIDRHWTNRRHHVPMYTDYFNFSSDNPQEVRLRLDQLSYNVLIEEYPKAERDVKPDEDGNHWIFTPSVCSMIGIGRFVLGLYDHIEVQDSPELEKYLDEKLDSFVKSKNKSNIK